MFGKKKKVLAVEDAADYQMIIRSTLQEDYELTLAASGKETYHALECDSYDLILLDIILPDCDGFEICSSIRSKEATKNTPIIFVTSKESIPDKVMGFSLGADDYITKPFNTLELKARVAAKLRMSEQKGGNSVLVRGDIEINIPSQRISIIQNQKRETIDMTSTEFRLLLYMVQHVDHVLSREQILDAVWGDSLNVTERTVDTHVSKLRKKLEHCSEYIKSVHGSGYRFTVERKSQNAA